MGASKCFIACILLFCVFYHAESNVMFVANINMESAYYLPGGDISSFNQVLVNTGDCFDSDLGKFTAPRDGVYEFSVEGIQHSGTSPGIRMFINDHNTKLFTSGTADWASAINGVAIVRLSANDEVTLNLDMNESIFGSGTNYFMFAGKLLE